MRRAEKYGQGMRTMQQVRVAMGCRHVLLVCCPAYIVR